MKARPSRLSGALDSFGALFLIRPYRCGGCRERFYVLRLDGGWHPYAIRPVRRERALRVLFKIRHGLPIRVVISLVYRPHASVTNRTAILTT
jgi:hypothetical protein